MKNGDVGHNAAAVPGLTSFQKRWRPNLAMEPSGRCDHEPPRLKRRTLIWLSLVK